MKKLDNTKTAENLHSAFAGESMANRKYLYFAKVARKLGNEEIAKLFEETAHQETGHAFSHLELLYPSKELTVEKILELAIEGELYETNEMYPGFEKTALEEGKLDAAEEFVEQGAESREHAQIFEQAAKRFKALTLVEKYHATKYQNALAKVQSKSDAIAPDKMHSTSEQNALAKVQTVQDQKALSQIQSNTDITAQAS